ncbi:MAG: hypothetical protein COB49_08020 [Alphaproteobacteria bacterium]|nr:MAG: hypothetical protein COB49_08020 [Alphaproteobacteria bacterium]
MTAYMVILAEISDPESFRHYVVRAAELVTEYGGEYVARGTGESQCLEGDWPDETRLVISKWPSMEQARAFWNSERYSEIRTARQGNSTVRVRLIEGVEDL